MCGVSMALVGQDDPYHCACGRRKNASRPECGRCVQARRQAEARAEAREAKRLAEREAKAAERREIAEIIRERKAAEREEREREALDLGRGIAISPWNRVVYIAPRRYPIRRAA